MSSNNGGVTTAKKLSKSKDEDGDIWEVGREIYKQADEARQDAVKQLFSVAEDIRGRAQETDGEARHRAHRVARNLEQAANYINGHTVDQIEETTEVLRHNMWKLLGMVFLVGMVVGLISKRKD